MNDKPTFSSRGDFCARNGISYGHFHNEVKRGRLRITKNGWKCLVSDGAEREYHELLARETAQKVGQPASPKTKSKAA